MSNIKQQIQKALVVSQKAKDSRRLSVLRQITAAIKQHEIDSRTEVSEQKVMEILTKLVKQRNESISQFTKGERLDLVAQEEFELKIIKEFLPTPLTQNELNDLISAAIQETGAASVKDMGKVLGLLKPKLLGRADMAKVSTSIKESLAG